MKTLLPLILLSIVLLIGCSQNKASSVTQKSLPTEHVQKSTELKTIMHKFDNLIFQHYKSELDRDKKRIDYAQEMIEIVDDLVINSQNLQKVSTSQFTAKESQGFLTLAQALEVKSEKLKSLVLNYKTEEIAPTLDEINLVCTKCHDTLR